VVDHRGRLLGIVTRADLLSAFTRPDEEIRREITQDVIADGFFTDPDLLAVTRQGRHRHAGRGTGQRHPRP
jgi:CBS domain-containing protein